MYTFDGLLMWTRNHSFHFIFQDGLIIENMHDIPYSLSVGPEVCAGMTAVCSAVRSICPSLPLGVQILSAANQQALAVALASGSFLISINQSVLVQKRIRATGEKNPKKCF